MTDKYKVTHINRGISPSDMADVLEVIRLSRELAINQQSSDTARKYFAIMSSYETHLFHHMTTIEEVSKLGVDNET
jgi:hypothetical protein